MGVVLLAHPIMLCYGRYVFLAATMDEDEFNQGIILPPLIIQLRKILDQYPDDTQILKVHNRAYL